MLFVVCLLLSVCCLLLSVVYCLFIALGRVLAFRRKVVGWVQDFVWELAHKENHVLIPPGASAPTLHEGFISVFVFLKATSLKV